MPGAQWFQGAQFNYAQQVFRHVDPAHAAGFPAVISRNEKGQQRELSWPRTAPPGRRRWRCTCRRRALQPGDRVAAYLPNIPEAMVAFLAVVSIGGIWSICAPDMGTNAVLDRFRQIEPKVLIACDGVTYGGRDFDRTAVVAEMRAALPSVRARDRAPQPRAVGRDALAVIGPARHGCRPRRETMRRPRRSSRCGCRSTIRCGSSIPAAPPACPSRSCMATAAPCWWRWRSRCLHNDIGCSYDPNNWGERFHWYSSTGWVMWNAQTSGLLHGTTCCIYDGNPGGTQGQARTGRCCGASPPTWASPSSAPARPSSPTA